jgi:hypothetical protein
VHERYASRFSKLFPNRSVDLRIQEDGSSQLRISRPVGGTTLAQLMQIPVRTKWNRDDDKPTPARPLTKMPFATVAGNGSILDNLPLATRSATPFNHVGFGMKFVFEQQDTKEGLQQTMECLYRWIMPSSPVKEYKGKRGLPCRTLVICLPKCDGMVYDAFVSSVRCCVTTYIYYSC